MTISVMTIAFWILSSAITDMDITDIVFGSSAFSSATAPLPCSSTPLNTWTARSRGRQAAGSARGRRSGRGAGAGAAPADLVEHDAGGVHVRRLVMTGSVNTLVMTSSVNTSAVTASVMPEDLVEHDAEGVHVRGERGVPTRQQLRRHPAGGAATSHP